MDIRFLKGDQGMQFRKLLILKVCFFGILFSIRTLAANRNYYYAPETVELKGKIEHQTFPGLPNYESIATGDSPERGLYLRLDNPINVIARKTDEDSNSQDEKTIKIVQLTIVAKDPTVERVLESAKKGSHFSLVGHLFHRLTGHHHARVLLEVERMN